MTAEVARLNAKNVPEVITPSFEIVDLDRKVITVPYEKLSALKVRDLWVEGNCVRNVQGLSLASLLIRFTNRLPRYGVPAYVLVEFRSGRPLRIPWRQAINDPGEAACLVVKKNDKGLGASNISFLVESGNGGSSPMMSKVKRITLRLG